MPVSEQQRQVLRNRLIEILGEEEAGVLMDSLPPVYWHDLATKDDLVASEDRLRTEMNGKFAVFAAEVRGEFANVYAEFKTLRAENKELRGEMALQFAKQTRTMVFTMLAFAVPTWGSILAFGIS
ncbi:hypothetical protein [Candidatus Poriferisocius sp.]|uniref:hypothetical protein n=1 Tax=Candidatus Poriferisocius sp. TaxID=3101276 RepID=UPI003B0245B6